jgi:hypothetical protein
MTKNPDKSQMQSLLKTAVTDSAEFENFKDNFLFPFVFLPIERPDFNKFLELHFKVYNILYKKIYSVQEYAKIALDEELNEFEIYGMQLKEVLEKNPKYFNELKQK